MAAEDHVDAGLRRVAVPGGLERRLALPALFDDAALDRLLGDVPVPAALGERLRNAALAPAVVGPTLRGVDLERAASMVRGATAVEPVRPVVDRGRRRRAAWSNEGVGIVVAAGLMVAAFVAGRESSRAFGPSREQAARQVRFPESARTAADAIVRGGGHEQPALAVDDAPAIAAVTPPPIDIGELVADRPATRREPGETMAATESDRVEVRGAAIGPGDPGAIAGSAGDIGMKVVPAAGAGRRTVPRVRGYDLAFEMAHGEPPFVSLAAVPALATNQPPLSMRTASFDDVLSALADKRLAAVAGRLRTEDVLAAVPLPAARAAGAGGGPRLDVRGVRSLRKDFESDLVEVCVSVPASPRRGEAAIDVLVVLDQAAGMVPATWSSMCRGLEHVAGLMQSEDRVSVVVAGLQPRLVGRRLDGPALAVLARSLLRTRPVEAGDFDAAMRFATTAVDVGGRGLGPRLVVMANVESADRARDAGREAVSAWRESLVRGVDGDDQIPKFVLIDGGESLADPGAEPAFGRTPPDALAIRRAVVQAVFGGDRPVAERCRLSVTFDPRLVQSYRVIGYRQTVAESLADPAVGPIDLHAGEAVRVVYEIVRRPGQGQGQMLSAAVVYRPTGSDQERSVSARLSTSDPDLAAELPSPHGCELLLAVGLGQTAGGSIHAGPRGPAVQSLAAVAAAWRKRGDVTAFGDTLIECLDRLGIIKDAARPLRSVTR